MDEKYLKFIFDSLESLPNNPDRESLESINKKLNLLGADTDIETIEKISILKSKGYTREAGRKILKDKTLNEIKGLEDLAKKRQAEEYAKKEAATKKRKEQELKDKIEKLELNSGSEMMKVSEYKIIGETHVFTLEKAVNNAVNQGWTPLGGVCVDDHSARITGSERPSFFQAIVKYS